MPCIRIQDGYICSPTRTIRDDIKRKIRWTTFSSSVRGKATLRTPDFGVLKCTCCHEYGRSETTDKTDNYWTCFDSGFFGIEFEGIIHGHNFLAGLS